MTRPGRLLAAFAAVVSLVACQPSSGRSAPPSATTPFSLPAQLKAADDRFFGGDYGGAEKDYLGLVKQGVPGAAAHYSLLLVYEARFKEALAQATAGVQARADSSSLARLTRALDWSQDLPSALVAGARAVAAKPVDPLAHVFYSEALADSGRFTDAESELRAADQMGATDAYTQAELYREWSNYWRDRQDGQQELNYTELAAKAQPRFPERHLEMARYQYSKQNQAAAQATLAAIAKDHASHYWVLVGAGDAAFLGADFPTASQLYGQAAQVEPGGAAAVLGRAEIAVARSRDFNGAHDLLLAALRQDPTQEQVYLYLRYLDLLVLKTDPDQELKQFLPGGPAALEAARKQALDRLNQIRAQAGVAAAANDAALAEAAEAHSYYFLFNYGQPQLAGLGIHSEDPSLPGYVGSNGLLRARHFGYQGTRGSEVINHVYTPQAALQVWVDSVFHRFPLITPETQAVGYGEAQLGILSVATYELGLGPPGTADPVVYPAPGQRDVAPAFTGNEIPDPVPQGGQYPVGYPVTLEVGSARKLEVGSGRLIGPDGQVVPSYVLNPGEGVDTMEWALLAKQPLKPGATYTAEVIGKLDGQDWSKRWQFTVAAANGGGAP